MYDECLVSALDEALSRQPDVAVVHRVAYGAGGRYWYLLTAGSQWQSVLHRVKRADSVAVFLTPEFAIRGLIDDSFVTRCVTVHDSLSRAEGELLAAIRLPADPLLVDDASFWRDPAGLREWLEEHRGQLAVAGRYPDLWHPSDERLIVGYVPDPDGAIRPGAY